MPPVITDDASGNESVTFFLQSKQPPITQLTPTNTMHFTVEVAKDYASSITISNAVFWGASPTDTLCYVINSYTPEQFTPAPSCGDSTLRTWLNGVKPTSIIGVSPNPSFGDSRTPIVISYNVNVDNLPITIELYNALGEKVRTIARSITQNKGEYDLPFGVSNMSSGLYILRITSPGYVESSQFLIQK